MAEESTVDNQTTPIETAETAPARLIAAAAVEAALRHRLEAPVGRRRLERHHAGHDRLEAGVAPAGFEDADAVLAALAQAARGGAPARSSADDDDVGFFHSVPRFCFASQRALIVSDVSRLPSWLQPGGLTIYPIRDFMSGARHTSFAMPIHSWNAAHSRLKLPRSLTIP